MSIIQQASSTVDLSFIENFLDCNDSLPDDIQRNVSQLRELDLLYRAKLDQTGRLLESFNKEVDGTSQRKYLMKIQRCLVRSQEYGDEKLQLVSQIVEQVENRNNQIATIADSLEMSRGDDTISQLKFDNSSNDVDNGRTYDKPKRARRQRHEKIEKTEVAAKVVEKPEPQEAPPPPAPVKAPAETKKQVKKKTKTNKKKKKESTPEDLPIDPDEPTYCLCHQVSFGDMIGCDNDDCPIEWFHFVCVNLTSKPKGKWYCPDCTSDRKEKGRK